MTNYELIGNENKDKVRKNYIYCSWLGYPNLIREDLSAKLVIKNLPITKMTTWDFKAFR